MGTISDSIWTTSITVFEIRFGCLLRADGRRRRRLEHAFSAVLDDDLEGRVLPVDATSGQAAAVIAASQRRRGRLVEIRDVLIAGIATARKATLATRNTRHFGGLGLRLVNPWSAE